MKTTCRAIVFSVLFALLVGSVACRELALEAMPTTGYIPSPIVTSTDLSSPTVAATASKIPSPTMQLTPSPTPWLSAFSRVTQTPVRFWWSEKGSHLHYEENQRLWRYDPATGETVDITSEAPIYGQPLSSVLSRIPDGVPEHNIYFAPSGARALFVVETCHYEDGTPSPDIDGEVSPSGVSTEVWYVTEEELGPRRLGTVDGPAGGATWSQDERIALLPILDDPFFPWGGNGGWVIALPEGRMWNLPPIPNNEPPSSVMWSLQIASDGQRALSVQCLQGPGKEECKYWLRTTRESDVGHYEPIEIPFNKWNVRLLPNNRGLIAFDGIVIYLGSLENGTWLQLNNTRPPYTWGSVPMDPPGETTRVVKFSSDVHYIAWNGSRGLQVFSLCPGGGKLLDCE